MSVAVRLGRSRPFAGVVASLVFCQFFVARVSQAEDASSSASVVPDRPRSSAGEPTGRGGEPTGEAAALAETESDEFFAEDEELEFEAVAEVEAPPREPTKRTLDQEQLTVVPGTRGDALRAVEVMPGVSRTAFGDNAGPPLLRGSPSGESIVLLDGAQVPLLYHFGGLTSFFNSHLLESVELYPGNYSARFGRAAGGVVEARVRDPRSDGFHATLELSALDSFALVESPLSDSGDTSLALAARRSNVDPFFEAALSEDSATVVAAPVYYDYQAILAHRWSEANKIRALFFGSADRFELVLGEALAGDPAFQGEFGSRESFHRGQVELSSRFSDVIEQELMVSVGPTSGTGRFGDVNFDYDAWDLNARAEWSVFSAPWLRVDGGFDFVALWSTFEYNGPAPGQVEGVPVSGSVASETPARLAMDFASYRPATYLEASIQPTEAWLILPGVRADYFTDGDGWSLNPRLTTRFSVTSSTTLKGGIGYYSQPPAYWEAMEESGNPNLDAFRALQSTLGIEQKLGESVSLDVEGFYKDYQDRIIATEGGAPPTYVNGGTGRAYGMELLLDYRLSKKSQAFAAYTLSRSERRDGPQADERLFDFDQTHNLSLAANYDLGSGWLVGGRFRYVTGSPYSEVVSAVYDASSDTYRPLYGQINGARHPAFRQLDLRAEKTWGAGPVDLTVYLEVMNVTNAQNEEGRRYSFDYQESAKVVGMPFFPNIGIRGEL